MESQTVLQNYGSLGNAYGEICFQLVEENPTAPAPTAPAPTPTAPAPTPTAPAPTPTAPAPTLTTGSVCINDSWRRDSGCDGSAKVCVLSDGVTEPELGQAGSRCIVCLNHRAGGKDRGCSYRKPNCVLSSGDALSLNQAGDRCEY